ncbi:FkbM family methyltransferase [bacterium]|nr:FkbM family methyltransferase [bacterium]
MFGLAMKNLKRTVKVNEIKYIIKNENDLIQKSLVNNIQWNNSILFIIGQLIKKFNLKHFLNIGCHIGTVALPLSKYIKKVTAIEAYPLTFQHLEEHIKINNLKNIEVFNLAIGDENKKIYFLDDENIRIKNNSGGMHVITDGDILNKRLSSNIHSKKYSNEMKKLDDLNISNFDILLADVEGKEYELLKGGKNKIIKYKPIIIVEIWNNKKRNLESMQTTSDEIINYVKNLGYILIKQLGDNYIFFPKDKIQ